MNKKPILLMCYHLSFQYDGKFQNSIFNINFTYHTKKNGKHERTIYQNVNILKMSQCQQLKLKLISPILPRSGGNSMVMVDFKYVIVCYPWILYMVYVPNFSLLQIFSR